MISASGAKRVADEVNVAKKIEKDRVRIAELELAIQKAAESGVYSLWTVPALNEEVQQVFKAAGFKIVNDSPSQYPDEEEGTTIHWK